MNTEKSTPLMQQYQTIKKEYPNTLLLFQVGDFYELFFEDAKRASQFLGITLTKRGKNNGEDIPLCGVPVHTVDHYLAKLIKGGFKVAICDQLEEPKPGSVVKRGVTRVLTPGTLTEPHLMDEKSPSFLCSFVPLADSWALLFGELLTAQLFATILPPDSQSLLETELTRFFPDEILLSTQATAFESSLKKLGYYVSVLPDSNEKENSIDPWLTNQFKPDLVHQVHQQRSLYEALYYFYAYVSRNHQSALVNFKTLQLYKADDFLLLDKNSQFHLELVKNTQDGSRINTLWQVLDRSATAMGSRMIKKWIMRPLCKENAIVQRQEIVGALQRNFALRNQLYHYLVQIGDVERVIGRILLGKALLVDYVALLHALMVVQEVKKLLAEVAQLSLMQIIFAHLEDFSLLCQILASALNQDNNSDYIIKKGFDYQLDQVRSLVEEGHLEIVKLEQQEQKLTGINTLKIRFNDLHGYYIEVSKGSLHLVPAYYTRVQTLVGRERFMIPALHQLQYDIARAKQEINQIEKELLEQVKTKVRAYATSLRKLAYALAHIDALTGLATAAYENNYVQPIISNNKEIILLEGRHPIIEQLQQGNFIANNTHLNEQQQIMIITGPNMGGKSTYLRQVALNCIMAHIGSFVAATQATIGLIDRIFTRIGAGDNLAAGKSTFLVEMEETALICNYATARSLVILDEVGRGTSTFDGLALAQAVLEHLALAVQPFCLFATHYHELTLLPTTISHIKNYYAASAKNNHTIVFLYKIVEGVADGSFGVDIAKLALLPLPVIERAYQLLQTLNNGTHFTPARLEQKADVQVKEDDSLTQLINSIDFNNLSPKQAFDLLWSLKK